MNKKEIVVVCLILSLVAFNIFHIINKKKQNENIKVLVQNCDTLNGKYNLLANSIDKRIMIEVHSEGLVVNNRLFDTVNIDAHLFLRLNTKSCQPCIESIMLSLNKIVAENKNKIIVLGSFDSKIEYKYYKDKLFNAYTVVDLDTNNLSDNQLESSRVPYFFMIDENNRIKNLFIPDNNFMFLTDTYLKNILPCIN